MTPPKTRIGRFLLLGILLSTLVAPLWVWLQDRPFSPNQWHGYTISRDDVMTYVDGEPVQYAMDMWLGAGAISSELRRQTDRCDPAKMGSSITAYDYREVMLCNTAALDEVQFSTARRQFEAEVDTLYGRYFFEWAWLIGQRLLILLGVVVALAGAAWAARWVRQGQPS